MIVCLSGFQSSVFAQNQINFSFQQPSYVVGKDDTNLDTYTCDTTKDECKINFDFRSSFSDDFKESAHRCEIGFGFGITEQDGKCNPNTVIYPSGTWSTTISIFEKEWDTPLLEKILTIQNSSEISEVNSTLSDIVFSLQQPSYILEKEDTTKERYACDLDKDECKINWDFRPTFEWLSESDYVCLIDFWFGITEQEYKCNPNTIVYPAGEWTTTIQIQEKETGATLLSKEIIISNAAEEDATMPSNTPTQTNIVVDIPQIQHIFQQPTYFSNKEEQTNIFTCDSSKELCKVNWDFEIQTDTKYTCDLDFGFWPTEQDHKCNPNTIVYPDGEFTTTITLFDENNTILTSQNYTIINTGENITQETGTVLDSTPLIEPRIDVQSGVTKDQSCKKEDCIINLIHEPIHNDIVCEWNFGTGTFTTENTDKKCNPGYVHFDGTNNHNITLSIYRKSNPTIVKTSSFEIEKFGIEKILASDELHAHITLQGVLGKNKTLSNNTLTCIATDACSINFDGSDSSGHITSYLWDFWNTETSDRKNPLSLSYPPGEYTVTLTIKNASFEDVETFSIVVKTPEKIQAEKVDPHTHFVKITSALPNPYRNDTLEWIELHNTYSEVVDIGICSLDDIPNGGSKAYKFPENTILQSWEKKKFYKTQTNLALNNTKWDAVQFRCAEKLVDELMWDYDVPNGYIVRKDTNAKIRASVVEVIDGDTIKVIIDNHIQTIRLLGIDTPETVHPFKPIEQYGIEASNYTKDSLLGAQVEISFDFDPADKYHRLLAYVWIENELFNKILIEKWYARMEKRFPFKYYHEFEQVEKIAQKSWVGLWADKEVSKQLKQEQKEEILLQEEVLQDVQLKTYEQLLKEVSEEINLEKAVHDIFDLNIKQSKDTTTLFGYSWKNSIVYFKIQGEQEIFYKKATTSSDGSFSIDFFLPTDTYHISSAVEIWDISFALNKKPRKLIIKPEKKTYISDEVLLIEISDIDILLQGRIGKNKIYKNNSLACIESKNCSVNLTTSIESHSYSWRLNGVEFSSKQNPKSIKVPSGSHVITLVLGESLTKNFYVDVQMPKPKEKRIKKEEINIDTPPQTLNIWWIIFVWIYMLSIGIFTYKKTH